MVALIISLINFAGKAYTAGLLLFIIVARILTVIEETKRDLNKEKRNVKNV